jgi:cytochrome b6-f complex subunit 5
VGFGKSFSSKIVSKKLRINTFLHNIYIFLLRKSWFTANLSQPACTLSREAVVWKEILMLFNNGEFPVVEPLLSGIVLGLVTITLAGLFVAAYLQYKRGDQIG